MTATQKNWFSKYYEYHNKRCPVCGALIAFTDRSRHHIIPLSKGGLDITENIIFLHKKCHEEIHKPKKEKRWQEILQKVRMDYERRREMQGYYEKG